MSWWGKVIGGAIGYMLGGPLGALLGVSLGSSFDASKNAANPSLGRGTQERTQTAFFTATFAVMGHIAKADGHVTNDEIALAESLMDHFRLAKAQRKLARRLFNTGKQKDFPLQDVVLQFRQECHRRSTLIYMFMEIQVQAALADGKIDPQENNILNQVATILGLSSNVLAQIINRLSVEHREFQGKKGLSLDDAYSILGVKKDTPMVDIRKAYHRLRSQHHPDKLVAKGLPQEMMKFANEKSHEINLAWQQIKQARGS